MKPTSIIFLILSVVLIATGLGTCFIAQNYAEKNDVQLFDQTNDEDDNIVETHDFYEMGMSRINLVLKDVDVTITGSAEASQIEMYNFSKNTYEFKTNSKTLSLDNTIGLINLFQFTENGFEFSGLRHYLNINSYKDRPQAVKIQIRPDEQIKVFNITVENGDVTLENIKYRADYTINVVNGDVRANVVNTSSLFDLNITGEGNVYMSICSLNTANVNINKGNFEFYSHTYSMETYKMLTALGSIYVNGEEVGGEYETNLPISTTKMNVNIAAGDIKIGPVQE